MPFKLSNKRSARSGTVKGKSKGARLRTGQYHRNERSYQKLFGKCLRTVEGTPKERMEECHERTQRVFTAYPHGNRHPGKR